MSFSTLNNTATAGDNDYVAKSATLTFAPGETSKTITIDVRGDSKKEADETFYLDLSSNSSNSLFTKRRGIGTILNDDWRRDRSQRPAEPSPPSNTPPARHRHGAPPALSSLHDADRGRFHHGTQEPESSLRRTVGEPMPPVSQRGGGR
jgi:hypothetical protein